MRHRRVLIAFLVATGAAGLAGCGGSAADDARRLDASSAADASSSVDATEEAAFNAFNVDATGLATEDAWQPPLGPDYSDAAFGTVAVDLDSGAYPYCYPPADGSNDDCAVCEALDGQVQGVIGAPCSVEWLRCESAFVVCTCAGGAWSCAPACGCR